MGNKWLSVKPSPNPKQRLVCIPYAGQSAAVFDDWSAALPDCVEVCAVELPGRRRRYKEPHVADVTTAAREVELALRGLPPLPTAVFGHSMGALIAFELSLGWNRRTGPLELLVVSGCRAPHLKRREQPIHTLPREDFLAALAALGGTHPELLENEQLMRVVWSSGVRGHRDLELGLGDHRDRIDRDSPPDQRLRPR